MPLYLPLLVVWLALVVFSLADLALADEREVHVLSRRMWAFLVILLPVGGALVWLTLGRPERTRSSSYAQNRPLGPDDDPEFLAALTRRIARHEFDLGGRADDDQARPA
jgi:hypothetical protein